MKKKITFKAEIIISIVSAAVCLACFISGIFMFVSGAKEYLTNAAVGGFFGKEIRWVLDMLGDVDINGDGLKVDIFDYHLSISEDGIYFEEPNGGKVVIDDNGINVEGSSGYTDNSISFSFDGSDNNDSHDNHGSHNGGSTSNTQADFTFSINELGEDGEIRLLNFGASFSVTSGNVDEPTVSYRGKNADEAAFGAEWGEDGKSVTVAPIGSCDLTRGDLTITLPADYSGSLNVVNNGYGVKLKDLTLNTLTIGGDIPGLRMNGCAVSELVLADLNSRDAEVRGKADSFTARNCSGDIDFDNFVSFTKDCTVVDCLGEMSIEVPRGSKMNVKQKNCTGEIEIDRRLNDASAKVTFSVEGFSGEFSLEYDD